MRPIRVSRAHTARMEGTELSMAATINRTVDARGSFCPGPLMELIRAIKESEVGDTIAVWSADKGSKIDIPKWVEKAGHRLVSVESKDGYDEIIVTKAR
jgi:tRNA 2-thiouridine synthesizing protein A